MVLVLLNESYSFDNDGITASVNDKLNCLAAASNFKDNSCAISIDSAY